METIIILSILLIFSLISAVSYAYLYRRGRKYNRRLFIRCIELQDEVDRLNRVSKNKK